ncbi:YkvA family protein [Pseudomonas borbori]
MKLPKNFSRYLPLAQRFLVRGRLPVLLLAVARKGGKQGHRLADVKDDLRLLQGLCLAWWRGEYRAISSQALLAVVAGLLYLVTPLDTVPDWLLGVGLIDDLAVLAWVVRTWSGELEAFRQWRDKQTPERLAVIERLPDPKSLAHDPEK